jgi:hypothetical protein
MKEAAEPLGGDVVDNVTGIDAGPRLFDPTRFRSDAKIWTGSRSPICSSASVRVMAIE